MAFTLTTGYGPSGWLWPYYWPHWQARSHLDHFAPHGVQDKDRRGPLACGREKYSKYGEVAAVPSSSFQPLKRSSSSSPSPLHTHSPVLSSPQSSSAAPTPLQLLGPARSFRDSGPHQAGVFSDGGT